LSRKACKGASGPVRRPFVCEHLPCYEAGPAHCLYVLRPVTKSAFDVWVAAGRPRYWPPDAAS
jgi:hypothetical protein